MSARPSPRRRRLGSVVLATVAMLLVAACAPPPTFSSQEPSWSQATLTRDGADTFAFSADDTSLTYSAAPTNTGSDSRTLMWRNDTQLSIDAESCTTFSLSPWPTQEGVALRVQSSNGATRAITVTKNIWGYGTTIYNLHLWDTTTPWVFQHLSSDDMSLAANPLHPIRLCARSEGTAITFKVWNTDTPEPAWDSSTHMRVHHVPADWVYGGQTGVYLGHVGRDVTVLLSDLLTTPR